MAIDKNSKYYQSLLNKGYSDSQINQMYSAVEGGQSAKDAVANVKPANTQTTTNTSTNTNTTKANTNIAKPEYQGTGTVNTPTPSYQHQGEGNYVYNPTSGYYEKQSTPATSTSTSTSTPTTGTDKNASAREMWDSKSYQEQQDLLNKSPSLREKVLSIGGTIKENPNQGTVNTETPKGGDTNQGGWDYQDNSPERMQQIADNLERMYQSNPGLFANEQTFRDFFINGVNRTPEQEKFLMDYYRNRKVYNEYDGYTSEAVGGMYAYGKVPESYLNYVKNSNPQRYAEIMDAKDKEQDKIKNNSSYDSILEQNGFESTNNLERQKKEGLLVDKNNDLIDDRLYHEPTEEERQKVDRINEIDARMLEINNALKWAEEDLTKAYPGATKATIMALVNDRSQNLLREKDDLMVERTQLAGTVDYLQNERQQQDDAGYKTIANLQKNLGMYYDYSPEGMSELAQAQYAATNVTLDQADNGTDTQKQMALDSVLSDYFDKYGSIIQRSKSQVINDVMNYARKNGVSLSQALEDNFLKELRKKPGFTQLNSVQTDPYTVKSGDVTYVYDPETQTFSPIGGGTIGGAAGIGNQGGTAGSQWSNGNQVKLGEEVEDTGIPNVYGNNVKLAPTVGNMLQEAYDNLKSQGIDLQVGDSYRSYETQKKAYEEDQAKPADQRKGVAAPGKSFHELGQAIDIAQNQMNDPKVIQALLDAGFTRPVKSEPRHWSYGEGADAFGGVSNKNQAVQNPNPQSGISGYTNTGKPINSGGWINSLEDAYTNGFKDKDERISTLEAYGITPDQFNEQKQAYGKWFADNAWKGEMQDKLQLLLQLYDWETGKDSGMGDYHSGILDRGTFRDSWYNVRPTKATQGISLFNMFNNNETLNKFLKLKADGATFGAMSEGEWDIIRSSISLLDWGQDKDVFQTNLKKTIEDYVKAMNEKGVALPEYTLQFGGNLDGIYNNISSDSEGKKRL